MVERIRRSGLPGEGMLAGYCRAAAAIFGARISFFSLVTAREILFVAGQGIPVRRAPREPGLCSSTIQAGSCRIVADIRSELGNVPNRFVDNEPAIRFYAAAPIHVHGFAVGTIAAADPEPRQATEQEGAALAELARLAATDLERNLGADGDAVEHMRRAKTDEVLGWLSYGLSREFVRGLAAAMALHEALQKASPGTAPALMSRLDEAHARMAALTRTFRMFQEGVPSKKSVLNVNQVVDGTARLMRYVLGEHIRLSVDLGASLTEAQVEVGRLEFPLALVLMHARNAMEGAGPLGIRTGLVAIEGGVQTDLVELTPGDYATITVTDKGRTPNAAETQALSGWLEVPLDPESGATGLWLAQESVNRLGGQLDLAPRPEGGNTLILYLPVLAPASRERSWSAHAR